MNTRDEYVPAFVGNGNYQITGYLGAGNIAKVYRGTRISDGNQVAIKIIKNIFELDSNQRKDCIREANNMRLCHNTHILECYDTFLEDNALILVMEYAEAGDLSKVIAQRRMENRPIPETDIWRTIYAISSGLAYMASLRMMHRDIKPGNVLFHGDTIKLGDFGFSRQIGITSMAPNSVVGSPFYMSPEQIQGHPYSFASDIWSLGCVVYELAMFHVPFERESYSDLCLSIVQEAEEPISSYSRELSELVSLMLAKDPAQRPTAEALVQYAELILRRLEHLDEDDIVTSTIIRANPFDSYTDLGTIGSGQYSEVHRASCKTTDQIVAVKQVQIFDMDNSSRQVAVTEASLLQRLPPHPNIIRYLRSYLYNNDLYLILELADSGDLRTLLQERKRARGYFSEGEIWSYFAQIADAVEVMHSQRILHRDLKPANIFLAENRTLVKVGDLGHSRVMSSQSMQTFSTVGTPSYMSPEVLASNGYSFPSDVWSLGCILYELCTLEVPFYTTDGILALRRMVRSGRYAPISRYSSTLSVFISLLLRYSSDERPPISAVAEIAHLALDAYIRGQPVDDLHLLPTQPDLSTQSTSNSSSASVTPPHPISPAI